MTEQANHAAAGPEARSPNGGHNARISMIFEIARILATEHDLTVMLDKFLHCLVDTFEAADAGMLLLANEENVLAPRAAFGFASEVVRDLRIAAGESMSGRAFATGCPMLYPDRMATEQAMANLAPAHRTLLENSPNRNSEPSCAVCIPLIAGQRNVGVLVLENYHQAGTFTQDDVVFLQHVADLITLSIDNAALRAQLQAVQAVNEGNRLKAEVISTLAHEMRTPLTSIKGYSTALLMEEASFSPETQREFLQIVDEECDILQDLIHDLLESSIIDAGFLKLEREPVMLSRLAGSVVDDMARRTQKHRFVVDFAPGFPIVDADPHRIVQVLRNLLDNAVKYSPNGGLIVVHGNASRDEITISVADQGEGIAPEHLNRLFEKFFRIKSGLGRHVVGTGLGLPIARTIVESHGGRIWAASQLGQGTTFYFTLPLNEQAAIAPREMVHE